MHKYKIFNNFSSQNKGFWPPKSTKKYSFEYNVYNIHITEAKSRTLSLFTKNTKVKILSHIFDLSKIKV